MSKRKTRSQKATEYEEKYSHIPKDYQERLAWLYDELAITESKAQEILDKRSAMINSLYYTDLKIVLYEEPEGSPRPRFRLVNRANLANMAMNNPDFIHVYSPSGAEDNRYMKRLIDNELIGLNNMICTPCELNIYTFSKTPSYYSKTDTFLAEIGLHRPVGKPDWDNAGKKYSDMFNANIWLDDIFVTDGTVRKFYSVLPRVEIYVRYLNMVYNRYQYSSITNRKDYMEEYDLKYFGGI